MMSIAALILIVGKAKVGDAVKGNIFGAGMNAMVSIFGIAWMGDTFFNGNIEFFKNGIADIVTQYPFLFAIALFFMSIMLFSQAATVRTPPSTLTERGPQESASMCSTTLSSFPVSLPPSCR